jgi:pyridoxal 5'-phosphate synthase pdxT subunit
VPAISFVFVDTRFFFFLIPETLMKIGILAIQGDFQAHAEMLHQLGAETVEVRTVADLQGCDGLVLPGGESTTQLQFLEEEGLYDAIHKFAKNDGAIFGTCAGAILLANKVKNPEQDSLDLLDMTILRNGYGRQLASNVFFGPTTLKDDPLEMVFIRAPIIEKVGPSISILAKHDGSPTLVQKGHILAATFHPELTNDPTVHQHFLDLISYGSQPKSQPKSTPQATVGPKSRTNANSKPRKPHSK